MERRHLLITALGTIALLLACGAQPAGAAPRKRTSTPIVTVKPVAKGVYDRQHIAQTSSYLPVVNGAVVKANWSDLQPTAGGPIASANVIDEAIAEARQRNAASPGLDLRLKLRVYAGANSPEWAKQLDGPPITLYDPQTSTLVGTVPRFWTAQFKAAYHDLQAKLAAKYDAEPLLLEVVISRCTTQYAEPFLRQGGLAVNRAAYLAAGYAVAADQACHREQIDTHAATWRQTRSSLALNPYQRVDATGLRVDEPFTESMMTYCRQTLGSRCVLGSNSLSWPLDDGHYTPMYAKLISLGPPIYFQTATAAKMGDWAAALDWAATNGVEMVELNTSYDTLYPLDQLATFDARLAANAAS